MYQGMSLGLSLCQSFVHLSFVSASNASALIRMCRANNDCLVSAQKNLEDASRQKQAEAQLVSHVHQLNRQLDQTSTESNAQLQQLDTSLRSAQAENCELLKDLQDQRQVLFA